MIYFWLFSATRAYSVSTLLLIRHARQEAEARETMEKIKSGSVLCINARATLTAH